MCQHNILHVITYFPFSFSGYPKPSVAWKTNDNPIPEGGEKRDQIESKTSDEVDTIWGEPDYFQQQKVSKREIGLSSNDVLFHNKSSTKHNSNKNTSSSNIWKKRKRRRTSHEKKYIRYKFTRNSTTAFSTDQNGKFNYFNLMKRSVGIFYKTFQNTNLND